MGLLGSSKSSSTSNLIDSQLAAADNAKVFRGAGRDGDTFINVTDNDATSQALGFNTTTSVASVNAAAEIAKGVAFNAAVAARERAKADADKAKAITKAAEETTRISLDFGGDVVREGFEFGGDALDFADRSLDEVLDVVGNTLGVIEGQQIANNRVLSDTTQLTLDSIDSVVNASKTSGERTVQIIGGGMIAVAAIYAFRKG